MPTLADTLHDRVDKQEELRAAAKEIAQRVVKDRLGEAVEQSHGDVTAALSLLAVWLGAELADVTTEAVRAGADHAQERMAATGKEEAA